MIPQEIKLEEEEGIDIKKWLILFLEYKYYIILSALIGVLLAAVFTKVTTRVYEVNAKVLVKESSNPLDKANMFKISLVSDPYRLENERGILTSSGLVKKTLQDLNFYTEYFKTDKFGASEIYYDCPFVVIIDTSSLQPVDLEFKIKLLSDSTFTMEVNTDEVYMYNYLTHKQVGEAIVPDYQDTLTFGAKIELSFASFMLMRNGQWHYLQDQSDYMFVFKGLKSLISEYKSNLKIDIQAKSSILNVILRNNNKHKAEIFLNSLLDNFLFKGIQREDEIAERTIQFIDYQLITLIDSLRMSEEMLGNFRSTYQLVDIDLQTQQVYERQGDLDQQKAGLLMQKRYLDYLVKTLSTDTLAVEELIAPSTMGISDAVLNNLVIELVGLFNERTEVTLNTRRMNPYIESIDIKIDALKQKLVETIQNINNATEISLEEIDAQTEVIASRLSRLPQEQRELLKYERKFQLNDEIYTFLITKRSEMQIKLASNIPTNEILEEADSEYALMVAPNMKINYLTGLFLGVLLPLTIIYIYKILNDKILSTLDISTKNKFPIIATIHHDSIDEIPAITHHPESVIAESYRMLRANMQFALSSAESPIILFTSAMKGEGKSFNAINFTAACASYGKKVCLLDLDLRRPRLSSYLKIESDRGMSNLLIGRLTLMDAIIPVCNGLFDLIPAGPIPPNPSELIDSKKFEEILFELKKKYDRIVIDSPPIGIISETLFMSKYAGAVIMVVRHNVTSRKLLDAVLSDFERKELKGVNLIYNDVPFNKYGYYRSKSKYYYYSKEKKGFFNIAGN